MIHGPPRKILSAADILMKIGGFFMNNNKQKTYKDLSELNYSCQRCIWSGTGRQAHKGHEFSDGFALFCPRCHQSNDNSELYRLDWISTLKSEDNTTVLYKSDFTNNAAETEFLAKKFISLIDVKKKIYPSKKELTGLSRRFFWLLLQGVKTNYDSPGYTYSSENTISFTSDEGHIYDFYAFNGHRCGGSEWEVTEKLRVVCKDMGVDFILMDEVYYSR